MNYELALQLKNTGFPIRKMPIGYDDEQQEVYGIDGFYYFIPTLSELIRACGDDSDGNRNIDHPFSELSQMSDFSTWEASCWFVEEKGIGLTPEEAVAKLWLALNEK